jgi:hypothetical protein
MTFAREMVTVELPSQIALNVKAALCVMAAGLDASAPTESIQEQFEEAAKAFDLATAGGPMSEGNEQAWTQEERDQGWRYVDEALRDPGYYAFLRRRNLYPKPSSDCFWPEGAGR